MLTHVYRGRGGLGPLLATIALTAIALLATPSLAVAATQPNLRTADSFAVFAGSTVTGRVIRVRAVARPTGSTQPRDNSQHSRRHARGCGRRCQPR